MTNDEPMPEVGAGGTAGGPPRPVLLAYRTVPPRRGQLGRRVLWAVLVVQALAVAFQVYEVRRYHAAIEPHVRRAAGSGRQDWVADVFDWGAIYGPAAAQFVLVPIAASVAVDYFRRSRATSLIVLTTAGLAVTAWCLALTALVLSGGMSV
jgi:hypothetical protein